MKSRDVKESDKNKNRDNKDYKGREHIDKGSHNKKNANKDKEYKS